jgi:hypothetical protein
MIPVGDGLSPSFAGGPIRYLSNRFKPMSMVSHTSARTFLHGCIQNVRIEYFCAPIGIRVLLLMKIQFLHIGPGLFLVQTMALVVLQFSLNW